LNKIDNIVSMKCRVAIGYPAPGVKNISAPPPTKTAEFEVKYTPIIAEEAKAKHFWYFNVIACIWLKGYQNGNHIEPSEQRLQEISIVKIDLAQEADFPTLHDF